MSRPGISAKERQEIEAAFRGVVNMPPAELRNWLNTDESRSVGMTPDGEKVACPDQPEAVGHHMGERIVEINARKHAELTDEDYRDMRKVVGYVYRHIKQRPEGDLTDTRWRRSLMNWGHDPLKAASGAWSG